jgi:hypothetical protein
VKIDYDTENRTFEIQKPKPNRTTEISVRFSVSGKNVPTPNHVTVMTGYIYIYIYIYIYREREREREREDRQGYTKKIRTNII